MCFQEKRKKKRGGARLKKGREKGGVSSERWNHSFVIQLRIKNGRVVMERRKIVNYGEYHWKKGGEMADNEGKGKKEES